MSHHFFDQWLSPRLPKFYAAHPGTELHVETSDRFVDLRAENIDMAFRFSGEAGAGNASIDLYQGCYFPACSPGFAAEHNLTTETRDLTGVPLFVLHETTTDPAWIAWPKWLERFGYHKRDPMPASRVTGRSTAAKGEGLVLLGLTEAFNDLADGRLVAPLGPAVVLRYSYTYRLVWPAGRIGSRPAREFQRWIARERVEFLSEASRLLGVELS